MTIGDSKYGSGDPSEYSRRTRSQQMPGPGAAGLTSGGRKIARLDNGTVALALSGMAFYWFMPALMGRNRRAKRPARPVRRAPATPPATPPTAPEPEEP